MTALVNVIAVLHQYENFNGISKNFFCFSSYTNSQTSADRIATKRQNLPTKKSQKLPVMLTCMNSKKEFHDLN